MRVTLQPAYILHSRPYRETSVLLDVLSQDYGRVSLIARRVRQSISSQKALLQLFTPLLISWQGRSELMTVNGVEPNGPGHFLQGACLLSGFYLNELLIKLLHKYDPCPKVYTVYRQTLVELGIHLFSEAPLRLFEKRLLHELGYGLSLERDLTTGEPISAECFYRFSPEYGFELCKENNMHSASKIFSGKSLLALASEQLHDVAVLKEVKQLMRLVLMPLLGNQPLQSRKLFLEVEKNGQL